MTIPQNRGALKVYTAWWLAMSTLRFSMRTRRPACRTDGYRFGGGICHLRTDRSCAGGPFARYRPNPALDLDLDPGIDCPIGDLAAPSGVRQHIESSRAHDRPIAYSIEHLGCIAPAEVAPNHDADHGRSTGHRRYCTIGLLSIRVIEDPKIAAMRGTSWGQGQETCIGFP